MSKLRVYLADLVHNFVGSRDIWTVPLSVCDIAAYAIPHVGEQADFRLFKFPDKLLAAMAEAPPDVIGVSNYLWNFELSRFVVKRARQLNPDVLVVMGGPNFTATHDRVTEMLSSSGIDFYVSLFGEEPFLRILQARLEPGAKRETLHQNKGIHGVWFIDPVTKVAKEIPTGKTIKDLNEIPSPYLTGLMDEFLADDLMPMMETTRGCPFECTFCDWGAAGLRKLTRYGIERITAEIDYCRARAKDERLMFADANFGILGARDLKIAEFLAESNQTYGYPKKVIATWSQAKSDMTLEVARRMKDLTPLLGELRTSSHDFH